MNEATMNAHDLCAAIRQAAGGNATPGLPAGLWRDVTIVTPDGVHHNIISVAAGLDNEGDQVIAISISD